MLLTNDHFILENFEGSLDFLISLIQKNEIEVLEISIQDIIHQFISKISSDEEHFDKGAEFLGLSSYLIWLKSRSLLPKDQMPVEEEKDFEDPHFEIIHHLIDYCRFKEAAKELSIRQEQQSSLYFRGVEVPEWKRPLGIDHVTLEELSHLFKEMMSKAAHHKGKIEEENWRVCDKIGALRFLMKEQSSYPFSALFSSEQSRLEMIVIFLALLELMKNGELAVGRDQENRTLLIFAKGK